jgi:glutamate formiminotransferase
MPWIECVPNVSEGRREKVVDACATAIRQPGVALLDVSADRTHNRSVYTFSGTAAALPQAVAALFDVAIGAIDLRQHEGAHPRIGAIDVVPFVPLGSTPMADCVALARSVGREIAERHGVPVFLYEEASQLPERRQLQDIRRGGFEGLAKKMARAEWAPDFGPSRPHPSAGATAVGARRTLIAYNVNLATNRLEVAQNIARAVRHSSGGLPYLKAMAVPLTDRGLVQVSMNLTNFEKTSIGDAFHAVERQAEREGVAVVESELVGLAPAAALSSSLAQKVRMRGFSEDKILETRLKAAGQS